MYDINVLVNGSRCKQYTHDGKIFIEAKQGSEYSLEIKNSTWQRILAVCSVDGLDVLSGKTALESNPGYVVNRYGTVKIDGFRVSDDKVAKFMFDYKGRSYAASKEDGSERNVGVVAVRLFSEKVKPLPPPPVVIREEHHHHHHDHYPHWPYNSPPTIWCDSTLGSATTCCDDWMTREGDTLGFVPTSAPSAGGSQTYCCDNIPTKGSTKRSAFGEKLMSHSSKICAQSMKSAPEPKGFDMGTKWGEAKESRVIEVEFEKGLLALTTNIYYASRQSLIEMGVPLGNEKQINYPQPFANEKYAKPPKNWQG